MNKVPALHSSVSKDDLLKKYFIALIPLIIFSIYKNGIHLYINDLINIKDVFIPLYFYLMSILVSFIISKMLKENFKENLLYSLIIVCSISINTNLIIYPILLFILLFIIKFINKTKLNFNFLSLARIGMTLGLLLNSYSYLNIAEKLDKFNYNYFDIFLGFNSSGIATSSTFILIISLIILMCNKYYKKIIPITSSISYIVISLIIIFFTKNYDYLRILLSGTAYFAFIFIAADIYNTPSSKQGMFIYALLIGVLTGIISYLGLIYEASFISIFIISLFIPLINKIINVKYLRS